MSSRRSWHFLLGKLTLSKFLQLKFNNFLFRFLPFFLSRWYIACMGRLYYLVNRRDKALIAKTIRQVLHGRMSSEEVHQKTKGAFAGIFDHYHEKLFVGYSKFTKLLDFFRTQVGFQGEEKLKETLAAGKGAILVTGHFGAVELLPGTLAVHGFPTTMICRFQTNRLREALGRRAGWIGLQLIDADQENSFFSAVKALKAGRILITECDEFDEWRTDPNQGSSFLDRRLTGDRTLDILSKRSGAPVVTAMVQRDGGQQYTCHLTALDNGAAPVNMSISQRCLNILDASVMAHPEQWYQWKKFGKLINIKTGGVHDRSQAGYLAPQIGISLPDQA
jgi:Kdo2-lipid IVA lauroyltransferase/acyltransferase